MCRSVERYPRCKTQEQDRPSSFVYAAAAAAAAAVVASAAAHLVPIAAAPFPSMYSTLSSSASCCRTFLRALPCCWCSLNEMRALIPARSRML